MVQDFLHQLESCRKVLVQTVEADLQGLGTLGDAVVASQLVESLLDGRYALLVGSDIVEILSCIAVADIILIAELVAEYEVEEVVLGVLLVDERQLSAGLAYGKVLLEIEELRLDFRYLGILDFLDESTLILTVCRNRSDGRLLNLLQGSILAHALVYAYEVVVAQIFVGEIHDVLLGQLALTLQLAGYVFPLLVVDEGVYHDAGTVVVAVETSVEVQLLVGDDRRQEVVVELTTAQLRHLLEHEAAYLFQLLVLVRITGKDEGRIVVQTVDEGSGRSQLHLLLQVNLHQSSLTVGKHVFDDIEHIALLVVGALEFPGEHHVLSLLAHYGCILDSSNVWLQAELRT